MNTEQPTVEPHTHPKFLGELKAESPEIVLRHGGCRKLAAYRKSEVIFLGTCKFCERFLPKYGDRTVDQMVQAARSGKQNIIEGSNASGVSKETEIKLTGVAKASLDELLADYTDYLKSHSLQEWPLGDERLERIRSYSAARNDWPDYMRIFEVRPPETICNLQICLIHQTQRMLSGMLARQESDFKKFGGIRERMSAARNAVRGNDWYRAVYSYLRTAASSDERGNRANEIVRAIPRICKQLGDAGVGDTRTKDNKTVG